ncbi:MAG: tetratricopeptide repeat protein [Microcoleaceae cyanobacterium]
MQKESVAALLNQADLLQQQSQLTDAIATYRRAINLNPRFSWSYHYLGEALTAHSDWEGAIAAYRHAIELNPNSTYSYHKLGQVLTYMGQWQEAIACYRQAIELDPNFAECHNSLGEVFVHEGKIDKAITCYQTALEIDPDYDKTYINLSETAIKQGRLDEAFELIQTALQLNPGNWKTHQQLGEILQQQNKIEQAITAYQKVIKLNPESVLSYRQLGELQTQQQQFKEAIQSYETALKLEPKSSIIHHSLGHILSKQQKWDEAIAYYQKALQLTPDSAVVYLHWGEALTQIQQYKEAIAKYQKSLELDPDFELAHQQLGNTFLQWGQEYEEQEKWSAAVEIYRKAIQLDVNLPQIYEKLGDTLQQAGSLDSEEIFSVYQKAFKIDNNNIELAQKLLTIEPDNIELMYQVGNLLSQRNQYPEAIKLYQKIQKTELKDIQSYLKLGEAFVKANDLKAGINYYQKAIKLEPESAKAYHLLGEALQKQKELKAAKVAYEKAIEFNPDFFGTYHNLGDLLRQQQELDEAAEAYKKAAELNPNFYWSYHNLGDTYEQQGKIEEAITAYRQALKINPNFAYSYQNLGTLLAKKDQFTEAIACLRRAGELDPRFPLDTAALREALSTKQAIADPMYQLWRKQHEPRQADLQKMAETVDLFNYKPVISVIVPIYNTPDPFLKEAIDSVVNQIYPYWELCLADDASTAADVKPLLDEYAARDSRIKVAFRPENGHISAASNSALELATGEYICLLDHDDVLTPDALYEVALLLNRHPDADLIYSDEDKISFDGQLVNPYFKPEWSPESFLSRMYTCHLGTYRRSIIEEIGGWRLGYEGAQDYDLVLRFTEKTDKIYHIPKVLYRWRMHAGSAAGGTDAKPYAYKASLKALQDALERRGEKGSVYGIPDYLGHHLVRYEITDYKKVSIIIPTRDLAEDLERCLESIFTLSSYPNYEVILIDNGSIEPETHQLIAKWKQKEPTRFKCYPLDIPFNFSTLNNYGVSQATGDYLLFLNNDTEVVTSDWIEAMVEQVQRPQIGTVGALLLFPDDTVQHAGVVMGLGGIAGHSYYRMTSQMPGYFGNLIGFNNVSAVTGACLMCRREVFEQVGGLDETLTVAYNDVDFCLKLLDRGYRNLYLPHVVLYHHESKSRGYEDSPEKKARLKQESKIMENRWKKYIDNDPFYSPHLTRVCQNYSIRV